MLQSDAIALAYQTLWLALSPSHLIVIIGAGVALGGLMAVRRNRRRGS